MSKIISIEKCFKIEAECSHCGSATEDILITANDGFVKEVTCWDCGQMFEVEVKETK